jgi:hypothetical protein
MREDVHALALLPDVEPAPDAWHALERRLADEGILRQRTTGTTGTTGTTVATVATARRYAQIAAALVLFTAGTATGRMLAPDGRQLAQGPATAAYPAADTGITTPAVPAAYYVPDDRRQPGPDAPQPAPAGAPATFPANGARLPLARSIEEAAALLRQTEEWYLTALTRYAELTTMAETDDPIARLAALQSIVMTTQAALSQTPSDPVINGAHLTAVAQRDAALRHVAAVTSTPWH